MSEDDRRRIVQLIKDHSEESHDMLNRLRERWSRERSIRLAREREVDLKAEKRARVFHAVYGAVLALLWVQLVHASHDWALIVLGSLTIGLFARTVAS
ncbi:MAG: hypothetical protein EOO77_22155 [Oxalobacteraceae bacterium]|nr:MAG: hypothetical protein EOO77_22155 [Oxalobacteraceae bacterium]